MSVKPGLSASSPPVFDSGGNPTDQGVKDPVATHLADFTPEEMTMTTTSPRVSKPCWNCNETHYTMAPIPAALPRLTLPTTVDLGSFLGIDVWVCDGCGMVYLFKRQ